MRIKTEQEIKRLRNAAIKRAMKSEKVETDKLLELGMQQVCVIQDADDNFSICRVDNKGNLATPLRAGEKVIGATMYRASRDHCRCTLVFLEADSPEFRLGGINKVLPPKKKK